MPRKIVVNACYGGFSLSDRAMQMFKEATQTISTRDAAPAQSTTASGFSGSYLDIPRDNPDLVRVVETLGSKLSSGWASNLCIVEIPDDVPEDGWIIQEYDGQEWVAEKHRTWMP